jgi:hypothetical protein
MSTAYIQPSQFDNWGTPRSLFDPLNREFGFTLDPCAEPWSAKVAMVDGKPVRFELPADGLHVRPKYGRRKSERLLTFADLAHTARGQKLLPI